MKTRKMWICSSSGCRSRIAN